MPDDLRISADEVKRRTKAGEQFAVIDARNPQAWAAASDKAHGAIRVPADANVKELHGIPRNQPIVVYCT